MTEDAHDITDGTEPVPELDELLQEDPTRLATVPVQHDGPVTAYVLPSRYVQTWTDTVADTAYLDVIAASPKRARAVLISIDEPVYVSVTNVAGSGTIWPAGVPYEIRHTGPIYVKCATSSATTALGVTVESWAD